MAKMRQNITMYQGDTKTLVFTIVDEDSLLAVKPPKDISAIDLRWSMVKLKVDGSYSATPLFDKESTAGNTEIEKVDAVNGVAHVKLVTADTSGLKPGAYYHQLESLLTTAPLVVADGEITLLKKVIEDAD